MGSFRNIGGAIAAARNRINTNQQSQPGRIGTMVGATQAAATARGNQSVVSGSPGGMFRSIMQGRNVTNQNQVSSGYVDPILSSTSQTPINPQGFTNQNNIGGVFGQAISNTYNRQVGQGSPLMQTIDPLTGENIDPTMDQSPYMPVPPPTGVETPITPIYDINNQQL